MYGIFKQVLETSYIHVKHTITYVASYVLQHNFRKAIYVFHALKFETFRPVEYPPSIVTNMYRSIKAKLINTFCDYQCFFTRMCMHNHIVYLQHLTLTSFLQCSSGLDDIEDKQELKHTSLPSHITLSTQIVLLPVSAGDILDPTSLWYKITRCDNQCNS